MEELLKNEKRLFWSNLCYFIILTLFVVLRIVSSAGLLKFAGEWQDRLFTIIVQILILFSVPMLIYRFVYKQKTKDIFRSFGFRKTSGKVLLCSVGMGFVAFFLIIFVSTFFSVFIQMLGYRPYVQYGATTETSFWTFLLDLVFIAMLPGMFEEFSHRGMLMSGFSKLGSFRAVLLSGLLFGLMHLNITQFFYAFVVGMLLASVALITKSIWPSVIIHFINNGLNTYIDYAESANIFGARFNEFINLSGVNILTRFLLYTLVLCLVVYVGTWLLLKMFKYTKQAQFYKFAKEFAGLKDSKQLLDVENAQELLAIYLSQGKNIDAELSKLKPQAQPDLPQSNESQSTEQTQAAGCSANLTSASAQNAPEGRAVPQIVMRENTHNVQDAAQALPELSQTGKLPNGQKMSLTDLMKIILPRNKQAEQYKPTFKENFFLYCSIFLGAVVTFMTFLWGLF